MHSVTWETIYRSLVLSVFLFQWKKSDFSNPKHPAGVVDHQDVYISLKLLEYKGVLCCVLSACRDRYCHGFTSDSISTSGIPAEPALPSLAGN